MAARPDIVCIGSVLWDSIGRAAGEMRLGDDVPGRITRQPGGVALNIAKTLRRFGLKPALLSAVGRDGEGEALVAACARLGLITDHLYRPDDLPTDRYMAIESAGGLIAAIADAHALEATGERILRPLLDGRLGSAVAPWRGLIALDGNLTEALMADIAASGLFERADLRIAAASPDKAGRLAPLLTHPRATFYVNLNEAGVLAGARFEGASAAARGLLDRGAARVLVTHGGHPAAFGARGHSVIGATPPPVKVTRVTGAGDSLMAAHIVAEQRGAAPAAALAAALAAAAAHISGETGW